MSDIEKNNRFQISGIYGINFAINKANKGSYILMNKSKINDSIKKRKNIYK